MKTPTEIVALMMERDAFSSWMGINVDQVALGSCQLSCLVKDDMLNGFHILHGGISYALADSALAFASNSHGVKCMSIETSISHIRPVKSGERLTAFAREKHKGRTIGIYEVEVTNSSNKLVALFKGTVHCSGEAW